MGYDGDVPAPLVRIFLCFAEVRSLRNAWNRKSGFTCWHWTKFAHFIGEADGKLAQN